MKNQDNQKNSSTTDQRMEKVPVRLNPETLDDFRRLNPKVPIRMVKIGAWKYPCAIYELPEGDAVGFLTAQQTEAKREQRETRCMIADGKGGFIRCPEENKCHLCEKVRSFNFDNWHPTSLDALHNIFDEEQEGQDWTDDEDAAMPEPGVGDEHDCEDDFTDIMLILIDRLSAIRPKYGLIFKELLKGNMQPINIAKALNLGKSQIYNDVPRVQAEAQKIYFDLMNN